MRRITSLIPGFDTIFTGAGISSGSPSSLPQGDDLADVAWRLLTSRMDIDPSARRRIRQRIKDGRLRLEQLLNVMTVGGVGMPLSALVTVYEAVASTQFNYIHARLVELTPATHFTVNMDLLLEHASASAGVAIAVEHLHGRHDQPGTIVTTISQYLDQLDPSVADRLGTALRGQRVLVTGYSARDRDIHWLFEKYPPRHLTWLVYPSSDDLPDPVERREKELSPEARRLLDTLTAADPRGVDERRTTTEDYLDEVLPAASPRVRVLRSQLSTRPPRRTMALPTGARATYAAEPRWRRELAIAAVLLDQGMPEAAARLLDRSSIPSSEPDARIAAAKMRARAHRRSGHSWAALRSLLRPVGGLAYPSQLKAVANEASATVGNTRLYFLAGPLDVVLLRLAEREGRRGTAFQIATRIAQQRASRGLLTDSERRFNLLSDKAVRGSVDLGTWLNTLTWRADLLKVQGRIDEARSLLIDDFEDREYSDSSQKAYVDWKLLELDLVSEGPKPETLRSLSELAARGQDTLSPGAHCWLQLSRIGATRGGVLASRHWAEIEQIARRDPHTENFMHLQFAELARVQRNFDEMRHHLRAANRIERDRTRWRGSRTARLAAQIIGATGAAETASTERDRVRASRALSHTAMKLEKIGAHLPAQRARRNATLAQSAGDLSEIWQIAM